MGSTLTIVAVAISSIVILLALGRITRQLVDVKTSLKLVETKLLLDKSKRNIIFDKMNHRIDNLDRQIGAVKKDVV